MKRTAFFLLMLLTFYLSAMYYSMRLMGFFLSEVFLIAGMWLLSRYLKRHVEAEPPEKSIVANDTGELWLRLTVKNTGKLPAGRFRIPVRARYLQESRAEKKTLSGVLRQKVGTACWQIRAPYCGMLCLETRHILTYDYLGLFPGKIPFSHRVTAAILPPRQPLSVEFPSSGQSEDASAPERPIPYSTDQHSEIRQIHEYRPGDSSRHIHWNHSARTDRIWVKEYEKETDAGVSLLLDIHRDHWKNPRDTDAFYRLLYALALGVLQKVRTVKVYRYGGDSGLFAEYIAEDEKQCQDLLLALYRLSPSEIAGQAPSEQDILRQIGPDYLKLGSDLSWYRREEKIHQFSPETLEEEIRSRVFSVRGTAVWSGSSPADRATLR